MSRTTCTLPAASFVIDAAMVPKVGGTAAMAPSFCCRRNGNASAAAAHGADAVAEESLGAPGAVKPLLCCFVAAATGHSVRREGKREQRAQQRPVKVTDIAGERVRNEQATEAAGILESGSLEMDSFYKYEIHCLNVSQFHNNPCMQEWPLGAAA